MIWCVEDDSGIREIEVYTLNSTGFEARGFSDGASFREALETLDPEAVLLLDNSAADVMRETYADMLVAIDDFDTAMLKPGLVAHVQGRRVLALDGFEAALTDKAAKQRMWAYIKQLTPAAAPL